LQTSPMHNDSAIQLLLLLLIEIMLGLV